MKISIAKIMKRKSTQLGSEDIPLGGYITGYRLCSPLLIRGEDVLYIASDHVVQYRVLIPGGPQGYSRIQIPARIQTLEKLLKYLKKNHNFSLK